MCQVSQHAVLRARERWGLSKARDINDIIMDTYNRAQLIGDYVDSGRQQQLMLDARTRRVLVYNPDEDKVVTVWLTKNTPLALNMYPQIIKLHKRQIGATQRKIRSVMVRYNRQREPLQQERDILDREIQRLKLMRDHIDATLLNYEWDLNKLNVEKKSTVHSLVHYMFQPAEVGV